MIKYLIAPIDIVSRDHSNRVYYRGRYRYPKVHNRQVRMYELTTVGMVRKRYAKTRSKAEKVYPSWVLKKVLSENHMTDEATIAWAKDYTMKHSDTCFYSHSPPAKFARQAELMLALGFDFGTPHYVVIDRLQEEGFSITNIRGDSKAG